MYEDKSLSKKVCLIIGGNGKVGKSICKDMEAKGWLVISINRSKPQEEFSWISLVCDVTLEDYFEEQVQNIENKYGNIEVLINCGCVRPMKDFFNDPIEKWKESILTNSLILFVPSRIVGKLMTSRKFGSIINVSSIYGMRGPKQNIYRNCDFETEPDYAYNKSAIIGFTKYISSYFASSGVRANTVVLGGVENMQDNNFKKYYNDRVPMGRMCNPSEIPGVFSFLAGKDSTYITGAVICVDGGWTGT